METRNTKHTERRKSRKIAAGVIAALLVVVMGLSTVAYAAGGGDLMRAVASLFGIETQAEDGEWVVDPDTHDKWYSADGTGVSDQGGDSTKNTGRVWTDKSVYNSDVQLTSQGREPTFSIENDEGTALVGLSALSSAANISGQTTINQPLDIILVLDSSGSMNDGYLTSYTYSAVYSPNEDWGDQTVYYVLNEDGTYSQIEERRSGGIFGNRDFDGWYLNNVRVYPKTSADDADTSHIQFYTREQSRVRIDTAMENAVTNFIDTVATENVGKEQTNQHRISIVNYAERANAYSTGYGRDQSYFVYCTQGTNAQELKDYVTGLNYTGGTQADDGMALAEDIMNGTDNRGDGARADAKRVVVFFTDGMPGDGDYVENRVAGSAVNTAYNMKQSGTSIYTVGVFQNADPDDLSGQGSTTHDANYFMNAVSSNYPNAQSTQTGQNVDFSQHCTLGDRAEGNYYFAADSAEGLNDVFNSIYDDFGSSATSPIKSETVIGGEDIGYLTFTDTLGDYMEVKNFKSIIFAGQEFTQVESQDSGTTTTYTFQGTVDNGNEEGEVYPGSHDLSTIEITVEHSSNIQDGDVVTVKIPSNLIPLRLYTAESETIDGETTTTTDVKDAYPIRVYYTVGLKADVMDGDNVDASELDSNYIQSHTDENGNVYFYSNDYTSGDIGTTTAEFTPAETNSFYYFTENTPIYTAKNTDSPARNYEPDQTYYYQRTYYANDDVQTEWVSFVAGEGQLGNYVKYDQGSGTYYIEEGSPRLTRASEFVADKADTSITNTAGKAISPSWSGSVVSVALGNNGKVAYPVSGSLQISKNVDWGTTGVTHNDKDFEYTVDLGGTGTQVEGNFDYIKYNAQGQPLDAQDQPQELDTGAQPAATGQISDGGKVSLSNGEYVVISNLPANTEFSVTEADAAGYTAANTVNGAQSQDGKVAEGAIVSNDTVEVAYTNTYSVQPTSLAEGSFHGTKVLTGRDWKDSESFTFTLKPAEETPDAPLPDGAEGEATVTLTNGGTNDYKDGAGVPFNFGEIEYRSAGKYIYLIQETEGEEYGLAYSNAVYRVMVAVTDNGEGRLSAEIESVYNTFNDAGISTGADESQWPVVKDGNALFTNNFAGEDIDYANIVGKKNYVNHTTGAGLVINQFEFTLTSVTAGAPMPDDNTMMNDGAGGIEFADIEFGIDDIGKTYEYEVTEVVPEGADDNGNNTATLNGMTYDTSKKTVSIAVTQDQETGSVIATVTGNGFEFNNSYQASSVTTNGAEDGLQITKKLDGAPGAEGQFKFTLAAANDDTKTAIANGWITGGSFAADNVETDDINEAVTETVKTTSAIEKDGSQDITFDNLTFNHPGTYSFKVTETQDAPNDKWSYDNHTYSVTYTVTDNNGQLEIADPVITGESTFVNIYAVSMNYDDAAGGILFSKTLNGRALEASQFDFTVTTSDDASAAKLIEAKQTLSNRYGAADGATTLWRGIAGLTFDQDDVGQTFTFVVSEKDEGADGYVYDEKPVTVEIKVNDEGGKLVTETTVTKQGEEAVVYNSNDFQQGVTSTYPTAAFVNSYSASTTDAVSVNFEKQLTGRDWKDTDHFEFMLTPDTTKSTVSADVLNAAYKGAEEDKTAEIEGSDVEKTFSFGTFQFSETGTYVYNVNEVQPEEGTDTQGIAYDKTTAVVTFTVTDPGTGKLAVESSIGGVKLADDGAGIFENIYTYEPVSLEQNTDTGIGVQKIVTGAPNEEEFTFTATFNDEASAKAAENANVPAGELENIEGLAEGSLKTVISDDFNAGDTKAADFGSVTFNEPGVYVFDVTEDNQKSDSGWTYDTNTHQITVTVEDNTEGKLVASVEGNDPEFINAYVPASVVVGDDEANLQVTKEVNGAPALSDFEFALKLTSENADGVEGLNPDNTLTTSTNGLTGKEGAEAKQTVEFGDLKFTKAGDYTFQVIENTITDKPGWTYASGEENAKTITVKVTDDFNGHLKATTVVDGEDTNNPTFTNSYVPNGVTVGNDETGLQATKQVTGAPATEEFEFALTLTSDNAANVEGLDENHSIIKTTTGLNGKEDESETIDFGELTFTAEGIYTFAVTENTTTNAKGWTYGSGSGAVITVTVTDEGHDGQLDATTKVEVDGEQVDTNNPTIVNSYDPGAVTVGEGEASGPVQVTKNIEGTAPAAENFNFTLTFTPDADGNTGKAENIQGLTDNTLTTSVSKESLADNTETASFGKLTFTEEGDYYFTVAETNQAAENSGWTYDNTPKTVIVHVTDTDHNGYLEARVDDKAAVVNNSYLPSGVVVGDDEADLQVTKQVTGAPAVSEFEFMLQLTSDNAANVQGLGENNSITTSTTGLTGKEGSETVSFDDLTFTAAGDYTFTVDETTIAEEAGWTYDSSVKTITVHVTDDNYDGQLDATVEGNNPTFYNTYYVPEDAKSAVDGDGNDISGDMVGVGDEITYTIDWVNNAVDENGVPVNADVVITDTVPRGTSLVADSISEGGTQGEDGTITWKFEDQAPGASGTVSFKVTVTEDAAGSTVDNSADIKIGDNNPLTSTVTNPVPGKEETTNPDKIGEGTVLTYQITFTNTDGENASANVVDNLTKGQKYNEGSAKVQIGEGEAVTIAPAVTGDVESGQTLTWNLTDLPDNAEVVITFDVTVTRDAGASVDNTAAVNGHKTNTTTTPYPSDSKKDVANADEPTISIDGKLAGVGDTLIYTIDWAAEADGTLTITDEIPDGTAYVDDSADNSGVYDEDTNTITWTFEDLEEGDKGTVTFKVTITDAAVNYDEISNTASLQIGDNDPTTTNEVTTDIPKKEVSDTTPAMGIQVGDTLTYTIEYRNDTEEPATVTVTDILPAGLSYASVPEGQSAPEVTTSDDGREVLTWTFENVEPSSEASTVTFNTVVNENATIVEDPVTNKATVTVGEHEYDTNTTGGGVEVQTGNLTISKEIVLTEGQGTEIDTDKEFTFTVTLTGTNGQPLTGTYQYQIGDGEAQELDFNDNGQATLNLKHNESATITGLPDGADYTVTEADYTADGYTTTTPDNDSGKITADGVTVDFTNTYRPSGIIIGGDDTEAGITVQKTFTGRDWAADDSFEFTIQNTEKPESAATAPMPGQTTVTIGADGAADGMNSAAFGAMSFDTIGKYVYEITETHAGETIEGISYDAHTATVTVNVTDAGNGKLQAEVTYDNFGAETEADQTVENAAAFTNTYKPGDITIGGEDTQAGITVQKTLAGRAWETKDGFEFSLKAVTEDAPMPDVQTMRLTGTAGEETPARAAFGEMTFTKDKMDGQMTKDFVYTVTETSTGGNGVTVDPSTERTVTVTVTDDGKGNLSAEVKYNNAEKATTDADKAVTDAAAFTNTYDAQAAESVPANFTLTKVFEGHDWTENYTFQFRLTPVDGAPMPAADENAGVTIADDGSAVKTVSGPQEDGTATFDFGAITYEAAGDYTYTVTEISGDNPGVTYSGNTATVTVHVTDKGDDGASTGQLVASATVENGTFTNTYKTGEVAYDTAAGLQIVKNMTGRAIGTDEFTFTMTGVDEESIARLNNGTALEFKTEGAELTGNTASETIRALTGLTFTQTDVGNTYTYTVKETIPDGAADNGNGTYTLNGMTYDGTSYEVQFVVTEDGEGTLLVETFVDGVSQGITQGAVATNALPAQLVFNNSYDAGTTTVGASGEAQIQAVKVLNNDDIANYAEQFHFSVIGSNNVKVASGTNDAAGNITFSDIVYNTENLNAAVTAEGSNEVGKATVDRTGDQDVYTFNYTVSEDTLDPESGVSYNGGTFGVTVTVTDDRAGNLTVAVAYDNGGDKLTFENTYGADSEFDLTLTGNKVIAAAEGLNPPTLTGGEYQFTIVGSEGAPMPETTTVSNQGATVSFGPITYTMENVFGSEEEAVTEDTTEDVAADTAEDVTADAADDTASDVVTDETEADGGAAVQTAGRTKVFTYTISESGELAGVTNEEGTKTVEVTVTDMGGGELTAAVTNVTEGTQDGSDFTFTNTYSVTPEESTPTGDGEGSVTITKMLDGRSLNEGEFTFRMTDAEGNVVSEGTNDAAGNVELGGIIFEKPGTYSYTIREVDNGLGGVTYDTSVYTATAIVTDDQDGTLSVAWEVKAAGGEALDAVTFANSYKAAPTSVSLGAAKRLDGRALKDGEFTFELKDQDGNVVSSAKNDENGAVAFDTISFDKAGTYNYTVTEAAGSDETITYDNTVYKVTITVTDDGNGSLSASVDTGDKNLVFTNKYTKPAEPQKPDDNTPPADGTPKAVQTGDTTPIIPAVIAVLVSLAAIAAVVVIIMRRRRR